MAGKSKAKGGGQKRHVRGPFCSVPEKKRIVKAGEKKQANENKLKRSKNEQTFWTAQKARNAGFGDDVAAFEEAEEENREKHKDLSRSAENVVCTLKNGEQVLKLGAKVQKKLERFLKEGGHFFNEPAGSSMAKRAGTSEGSGPDGAAESGNVAGERLALQALLKEGVKGVEVAVPNIFEEEKLRVRFPDMGCGCKYFQSGKFEIRYWF